MIKLGIVMDPIANINIKKDSSFAMLLEAQRRGYELHYMEMADLYLINGEARARTRTLSVEQNYDKWYEFTGEQDLPLADLDVILMRKDPPFDTEFIYATYILERAEDKGTLIVNKPQSLRDCNEKLFTAWFSDLTPETLVTRNKAQLKAFWEKHSDIILKPLDGMGGASIFRVKEGDPNLGARRPGKERSRSSWHSSDTVPSVLSDSEILCRDSAAESARGGLVRRNSR